MTRKKGFLRGSQGVYAFSRTKSPFYQGRTLTPPPATWTVTPELRDALFSGLKEWLVPWERRFLVGKDKQGQEVYETRQSHFIRCSRCKQKETQQHFLGLENGLVGPYCEVCVGIMIENTVTDASGQQGDIPVYYMSATEKNVNALIDPILHAGQAEPSEPEPEATDLF